MMKRVALLSLMATACLDAPPSSSVDIDGAVPPTLLAAFRFEADPGFPPMELGSWHHAALRWDGTDKTLWWDGMERASGLGITRFDTGNVLVGADVDGGDPLAYFAGVIDDVELYAGALQPAEIAEAARP